MQEAIIKNTLVQFNTFWKKNDFAGGCILLAFSAGVDSVVLGELLWRSKRNFMIAHVNFNLRGEAAIQDARWAKQWAKARKVSYFEQSFDTETLAKKSSQSIQMLARELRYTYFEELAEQEKCSAIATAHHQDDSLETVLLNLSKGTGIRGLLGVPVKREQIIRPLLCFSKAEILDFAEAAQLSWREDTSNATDKYARNRIRHRVIPELGKLNPNLRETFVRNTVRFQGTFQLVEAYVDLLKKTCINNVEEGEEILQLNALDQHLTETSSRLVFFDFWLQNKGFSSQVLGQLAEQRFQTGCIFESSTHQLTKAKENTWVLRPRDELSSTPTLLIDSKTTQVDWQGKRLTLSFSSPPQNIKSLKSTKDLYLDADCLKFPLTLRFWKAGDRFAPLGMKGKHQLVADFLMHRQIDRQAREKVAVLTQEAGGEIIAILGFMPAESVKVQQTTQNVWVLKQETN